MQKIKLHLISHLWLFYPEQTKSPFFCIFNQKTLETNLFRYVMMKNWVIRSHMQGNGILDPHHSHFRSFFWDFSYLKHTNLPFFRIFKQQTLQTN